MGAVLAICHNLQISNVAIRSVTVDVIDLQAFAYRAKERVSNKPVGVTSMNLAFDP